MINSGSIECGGYRAWRSATGGRAQHMLAACLSHRSILLLAGVMLLATPLAHASFQRRRAKTRFALALQTSYCTSIVKYVISTSLVEKQAGMSSVDFLLCTGPQKDE